MESAEGIGAEDRRLAGGAGSARGGQYGEGTAGGRPGRAWSDGNLAPAGELSYGIIPQLEREAASAEQGDQDAIVSEAVRPEQIGQVVERWTGSPTSKMLEGEREKLLKMEEEIGRRVIGQR